EDGGPALGLLPRARWPRRQVELGAEWSLMMYTDGLIEGRAGAGSSQRLGQDGMVAMVNSRLEQGLAGEELLEAAVAEVRERHGGELTDDVAVLLLGRDPERIRRRGRSASRPGPVSAAPPATAPAAASVQRPPLYGP
ncbi:SpoIIE family protein phosphatase, partial [Streptomyces sp. SID2119]|uniref:SpoIIE family protein phosphatase n=1 Tax=Streptomyces sp. SID2119 TaxID=2690253 RepID=UPI00136E20FB